MDNELHSLLARAAKHVMTPKEIYDQRVSWIYGQLMKSRYTVDEIKRDLASMGIVEPT